MTPQRAAPPAHTPSGWAWALAGACIGLMLSVLVNMPAQWLANAIQQGTQGQVQLQEAQGSVWRGAAKLVLTGGVGSRDAMALPGQLQWQLSLSPQGWHVPRLNLQVLAACCMAQAAKLELSAANGLATWQVQIDDHRSQWPAHLLSGLGAPWNTLQAEGNLNLSTQQLTLQMRPGHTEMQGSVRLTAENMSSKLSTLRPMGTYQITLENAAAVATAPALTLTTLSGSLLLSGQGQWQNNRLQFRGEASAVPEHAAALSNLLNIIGRRQGARSLLSLG
jgi:general secretion pathway protein N